MSTVLTKKPIFIHETIKSPLQRIDESESDKSKYILTGPCAFFGTMNENGRIYELKDYKDKIEKLQPEIELGLHGEIEHTDASEPDINMASHCIKKLWYDESKDCIMITIQLLATEQGKKIMAMVDAGMPVYISSRASGYIDESSSKVELEEIYTYDIVRRPGFAKARLNAVNESKIPKSEKSIIDIYYNESKLQEKINNSKSMVDNKDFITKDEFKLFQSNFLQSMDALKLIIKENKSIGGNGKTTFGKGDQKINESGDTQTIVSQPAVNSSNSASAETQSRFTTIENYLDEVSSAISKNVSAIEDTVGIQDYAELIANKVNIQTEYLELIANKVNSIVSLLKDKIANPLGDNTDITENLKHVIKYAESIAHQVNLQESYSEEIAKRVNLQESYQNLVTKKINANAKVSARTKAIAESANTEINFLKENVAKSQRSTRILESKIKNPINERQPKKKFGYFEKGELTESVNRVLKSIEKKRVDENKSISAIKYPFMNLVDQDTKFVFESMSEIKKQRISQVITEKRITRKDEITETIKQINEDRGFITLLSAMPKNLIPLWENCGQEKRNQITSLSTIKMLRNEEEMVDFWQNVDFGIISRQKINESIKKSQDLSTMPDELGYSDSDVEALVFGN